MKKFRLSVNPLGDSVTAVNADVRAGDVATGARQQEGDGSHEVLGLTHLALGNEGSPLLLEVGVLVEDLLGQGGKHVARGDAVDADAGGSPLDGEGGGKVADTSLGSVVRTMEMLELVIMKYGTG